MNACPICQNRRDITSTSETCPQCDTDLRPFHRLRTLDNNTDKFRNYVNNQSRAVTSEHQTIRAKEQELFSSREALQAQDQKLQSAIQSLQAKEQELLSSRQKLNASEQELDSNKRSLQAKDQELSTKEQKLRSSNKIRIGLLAFGIPVGVVLAGAALWQFQRSTHLQQQNRTVIHAMDTLQQSLNNKEQQLAELQTRIARTAVGRSSETLIPLPDGLQSTLDPYDKKATQVLFVHGLFAPGRASLDEGATWQISQLVTALALSAQQQHVTYRVEVEGSADDTPLIVDGQDRNRDLARRRATAVVAYLRQHSANNASIRWGIRDTIRLPHGDNPMGLSRQAARTVYIHITPEPTSITP